MTYLDIHDLTENSFIIYYNMGSNCVRQEMKMIQLESNSYLMDNYLMEGPRDNDTPYCCRAKSISEPQFLSRNDLLSPYIDIGNKSVEISVRSIYTTIEEGFKLRTMTTIEFTINEEQMNNVKEFKKERLIPFDRFDIMDIV